LEEANNKKGGKFFPALLKILDCMKLLDMKYIRLLKDFINKISSDEFEFQFMELFKKEYFFIQKESSKF